MTMTAMRREGKSNVVLLQPQAPVLPPTPMRVNLRGGLGASVPVVRRVLQRRLLRTVTTAMMTTAMTTKMMMMIRMTTMMIVQTRTKREG